MTSTIRTSAPGSRRAVPRRLDEDQRARLEELLQDPDTWVLRGSWEAFLRDGEPGTLVRPTDLSPDQRAAALAWLRQQRHVLHRALHGTTPAPAGWLESLPLVRRLEELGPMRAVSRRSAGASTPR
ncbi:MAG: hypothetical protein JJT89_03205 [Nitriliruptoraceae bacterium]|nr:hypothetical protein [Nitriliruptoraceae bacterium]